MINGGQFMVLVDRAMLLFKKRLRMYQTVSHLNRIVHALKARNEDDVEMEGIKCYRNL